MKLDQHGRDQDEVGKIPLFLSENGTRERITGTMSFSGCNILNARN